MLTTQARLAVDSPRSCWSLAVRVFTMLVSIAIISWASATTARIPQRRGSPLAEGSTRPPARTVRAGGAVGAPRGALAGGRDDVDTLTPCTRAPQCPSRWRFCLKRKTSIGLRFGESACPRARSARGEILKALLIAQVLPIRLTPGGREQLSGPHRPVMTRRPRRRPGPAR